MVITQRKMMGAALKPSPAGEGWVRRA